jgi:flagellar biosynthesis/type III secretory pathway protein FliH
MNIVVIDGVEYVLLVDALQAEADASECGYQDGYSQGYDEGYADGVDQRE